MNEIRVDSSVLTGGHEKTGTWITGEVLEWDTYYRRSPYVALPGGPITVHPAFIHPHDLAKAPSPVSPFSPNREGA